MHFWIIKSCCISNYTPQIVLPKLNLAKESVSSLKLKQISQRKKVLIVGANRCVFTWA